jgi:hypothetical protein
MSHHPDFHPSAALDPINSGRASEGLEPYRAPAGRSQFVGAVILVLVTVLLAIFFP